jgi:heme oxygenase
MYILLLYNKYYEAENTSQERDKMKDNKYHTVGTVPKSNRNITLSEQLKKYHTVGIVKNISHCRNSSKIQ